jgi:beta-fructofuranosidase
MSHDIPAVDHRPRYHFTAARQWINDPNGLCFHAGRYHLYYQYNPAAPRWGDIHWGHASSADLVNWRDEPVALKPSPGFDEGGCFSGSFALVSGVPTLYYTGYTAERQVQCAATSSDLLSWTKHPERCIDTPPPGVGATDFRDPYVFRHGGRWYMAVGASIRSERGQVLLYRSEDGVAWQ